jgi:hypothetical protein
MRSTCISGLKISIIIILFLFALGSCSDSYFQDISEIIGQEEINVEIVITGGITSEKKYHEITLTKPMSLYDQTIDSISGATVKLKIGDTYYNFAEEIYHPNIQSTVKRKGVYVSLDSIQGIPGEIHTLIVDYTGKTYTASDLMVKVDTFDFSDIILPTIHPGGEYDSLGNLVVPILNLKLFNFGAEKTNIFNWYSRDSLIGNEYHFDAAVYDFGNVDQQGLLSEMYHELANYLYIRRSSSVMVKKMSVSPEYEEYLITILKETYWNTNIFSTFPANVSTNVSSGGAGYFYASDVSEQIISANELFNLLETE